MFSYGKNIAVSNSSVTGSMSAHGSYAGGFCGYKDGGSISDCNSFVDVVAYEYLDVSAGFCGYNNSGNISNSSMAGSITVYTQYEAGIGGFCGVNKGDLTGCSASGQITVNADDMGESSAYSTAYAGGLCESNTGTITDCSTQMDIAVSAHADASMGGGYAEATTGAGGLCYSNSGSINYSFATGDITASASAHAMDGFYWDPEFGEIIMHGQEYANADVGGLCGVNTGTIISSFASGNIDASGIEVSAGSLCGHSSNDITNCYATGDVSIPNGSLCYIGGLVGSAGSNDWNITNCYATSLLSTSPNAYESYLGGIFGGDYTGHIPTFTNCFWDMDTTETADGVGSANPDPSGVTGRITSDMLMQDTYTDWDFVTLWWIDEGVDYPVLWQREFIIGDISGSFGVDLADYAMFASEWGNLCDPVDSCNGADIDGNGNVDVSDLYELAQNWLAGK